MLPRGSTEELIGDREKMRVAIMQPTFLPWLGYFDLMRSVDHFIFLDNAQFCRQSWHHRNRVRGPNGLQLVTMPVTATLGDDMLTAKIADDNGRFWRKFQTTIAQYYSGTPGLGKINLNQFEPDPGRAVADYNMDVIHYLARKLSITPKFSYASEILTTGERGEKVAQLCEAVGATSYVSPAGALDYLTEDGPAFTSRDIDIEFQQYDHPIYKQRFAGFFPYASVIDYIFNCGLGLP
jgi:hypothetical protein